LLSGLDRGLGDLWKDVGLELDGQTWEEVGLA
jgi:hypothetical protein